MLDVPSISSHYNKTLLVCEDQDEIPWSPPEYFECSQEYRRLTSVPFYQLNTTRFKKPEKSKPMSDGDKLALGAAILSGSLLLGGPIGLGLGALLLSGCYGVEEVGGATEDAGRDRVPDASLPLVAPECSQPLNNTLFPPNADGTFNPLEWTTAAGTTSYLRLWKLPSSDAPLTYARSLFEDGVGMATSTANIPSFPTLDYRTDYLLEVSACSVSDLTDCSPSRTCQFTTTHQGLIGWWRFDESNGTVVKDSSGIENNHNGSLHGSPGRVGGIVGRALELDGDNDYVLVGDVASLEGMHTLTVEAWVNTQSSEGSRPIVSKWWSDPNSYTLRTDTSLTGKISFSTQTTNSGQTVTSTSSNPVNDGHWHHVVGVYNGVNQKVCIDDYCENAISQNGNIRHSYEELCFGAYYYSAAAPGTTPSWFFTGLIDEIAIYNRALSLEEIQQNYQRIMENF